MNKDNAHLYLPLVPALADGELPLNHRSGQKSEWGDRSITDFMHAPEFYCRKPKLYECWINYYAKEKFPNVCSTYTNKKDAMVGLSDGGQTIHMREVIE